MANHQKMRLESDSSSSSNTDEIFDEETNISFELEQLRENIKLYDLSDHSTSQSSPQGKLCIDEHHLMKVEDLDSSSENNNEMIRILQQPDTGLPDIYECANCAFPFNKREVFMRHIRPRKNRCSNCCLTEVDNGQVKFTPLLNCRRWRQKLAWYAPNIIKRVECDDCQSDSHRLCKPGAKSYKKSVEGPHQCNLCFQKFFTPRRLAEHLRLHSGDRPYRCIVCNKCFNYKFNLVAHLAYHRVVHRYQCVYCLKNAQSPVSQEEMVRSHINAERQTCEVCHKTADILDTLAKRYTPGPKAHRCVWCPGQIAFATVNSLFQHVQKQHIMLKNQPQKKYICNHCRITLNSKVLMDIHKKVHIRISNLDPSTHYMDNEGNLHTVYSTLDCTRCGAVYISIKALENHVKTKHDHIV